MAGLRVLVAEDDPVIALGLVERLRSLGHEPIGPARDGEHALELARADDPDVYLFDIGLPGMDGLAAAVQLAEEGRRRPVVVEWFELLDPAVEPERGRRQLPVPGLDVGQHHPLAGD